MNDRDDDIAWCLGYQDYLSEREFDFLNSISEWQGELTESQGGWLDRIMNKIEARLRPKGLFE